jgi:hypothetical protein
MRPFARAFGAAVAVLVGCIVSLTTAGIEPRPRRRLQRRFPQIANIL